MIPRHYHNLLDQNTMMEEYKTTLDDIWYFAPKFHFDPPFDAIICLIWTPPLTDKLDSWNLMVCNNTINF